MANIFKRFLSSDEQPTLREFIDSLPDKKQILLYDYGMGIEFLKALTGTEQDFVYRLMGNMNKYFGLNRIGYFERLPSGEFRLLCNIGKNDLDIGETAKKDTFPDELQQARRSLIYLKNAGLKHDLYMPIKNRAGNSLIRLFALDNTELGREFSSKEIEELETVANFISSFIASKVHEDQLRLNDPLTGAYSRNGFYEMRPNDFANVTSLAILDFDDFKEFNTKYGHPLADQVLKAFVDFVADRIRVADGDRIIRWGGDEFVVLFTKISPAQAKQRLHQIVHEFAKTDILLGEVKVKAHVTAGLVQRAKEDTPDTLVSKADRLMMAQKKTAKNKILTDFE